MDTDDPTVVNVWFIFVVLKMLWKDVPIIYSFLRMGDYLMEFCVLPIFGLKGPLSFSGLNGVHYLKESSYLNGPIYTLG